MKRFLILLLAVSLILGLSSAAWAAVDSVSIINKPANTVSEGDTLNISGSMSQNEQANAANAYTEIIYTLETNATSGNFSYNASAGTFSLTNIKGSELPSGGAVTFTLKKTTTQYSDETKTFVITQIGPEATGMSDSWSYTVVPDPTLTTSNILVTCNGSGSHTNFTKTLSGNTIQVDIPATCNNDLITISVSSSFTVLFSINNTSSFSVSSGSSATTTATVTNTAGKQATYTIKVSRPSSDAVLSAFTLTGGSASVSATRFPTSSGSAENLAISTTTTAFNFSATVSSGASYEVYTEHGQSEGAKVTSLALTTAGTTYKFRVIVTAANGVTKQTYYYTATRSVGAITLVSSGNLRTGSSSGTSIVALGALSSGGSQSLAIPAANRSDTSFFLTLSLPSGVTVSSASITGATASVSSTTSATPTINLSGMASNTTSWTLTLTFSSGGSSYTGTVNITRTNNSNILKSVSFISGSSTLGSIGALSGTSSQSLNLNTTVTSANVQWVLADGATLVSATWNNGGISHNASVGLPASGSTALVLTINASNNTNYSATINVSKSGTVTNTLSSLYIKNTATSSINGTYLCTTNPSSFASGTTSYTVYVPSEYDTIYIYPTPTNSGASVTVDGTYNTANNYYSGSGYFQVKLRSSSNTVNVKVTANNTTTTYTLYIEYEDNVVRNASLDSLKVSKSSSSVTSSNLYDMTPSFSYSRTKYEVDIAKSISEVYLHFTTYQSSATLSVSGATRVSDGVYKASLTANKTKTVTVTVSYRNDDTKYTVNLNSGTGSRTALLNRIRVASQESTSSSYQYTLLPGFDSSVKDYAALLPYKSGSGNSTFAYVQATLDNTNDTLTVDGKSVDSGNWAEITVRRGNSTSVPIKVRDSDGNTSTYNLSIVVAPSSANDDATLKSLSLRSVSSNNTEISISPSFSKTTTSYTASNVANSVNSIRVYADPSDSSSWIIVNDVLMDGSYATVDLDEGKNTITVQVYAEDCETNKTYNITVNRGAGGGSDSTLSTLEARYGSSSGQTLNLIPTFAKNTTSYRINVEGNTAQIAFRPVATDESAVIRIMGVTEKSGEWTSYNALSNDKNTFLITVTSGDGSSNSYYTVEVARGLNVVVSGQKLKMNNADINCAAYNINGNNYFKLRDIAYALRDTPKCFDVTYNSSTRVVSMTNGRKYSPIGGEMVKPLAPGKYQLSNQTVLLDGRSINLTAYNVDGNNYFMLREIGQLFNFGVSYDSATGTMLIDTSKGYTPEN